MARNPAAGAPVEGQGVEEGEDCPAQGLQGRGHECLGRPQAGQGRVAPRSEGAGEGATGQEGLRRLKLQGWDHHASRFHLTHQAAGDESCQGAKDGCCSEDGRQEAVGRGAQRAPQPAFGDTPDPSGRRVLGHW